MTRVGEVTFTGSLSEIERKADEWKAANPHVKIIDEGPPISFGIWDGHVELERTDWSIIVKYEDP